MPRHRKEISAAQVRRILEAYDQGQGFEKIGTDLGHCVSVIRRVLVENGRTIRRVGRPAKD